MTPDQQEDVQRAIAEYLVRALPWTVTDLMAGMTHRNAAEILASSLMPEIARAMAGQTPEDRS